MNEWKNKIKYKYKYPKTALTTDDLPLPVVPANNTHGFFNPLYTYTNI